jgi:hypothetical protein
MNGANPGIIVYRGAVLVIKAEEFQEGAMVPQGDSRYSFSIP